MGELRKALVVMVLLMLSSPAGYAAEEAGAVPEATVKAKEDDRLPIYKQEQWQFFFAPYVWIPGANAKNTLSGHTTTVSEPWWDIAAKLFSNANALGEGLSPL